MMPADAMNIGTPLSASPNLRKKVKEDLFYILKIIAEM